jgi:hypothetical protein
MAIRFAGRCPGSRAGVQHQARRSHDGGLSDKAMITVLEDAVEALDEGLS